MDTTDPVDLSEQTDPVVAPTLEQSRAIKEFDIQTWTIAFETVLEQMADGKPFDAICRAYHLPIQVARFRSWIFANEKRRNAYMIAKSIGAEAMEDELVRIADGMMADGSMSIDDLGRSTLKIETRKWIMKANNRKRYGDSKHVEQVTTTTTNIDVRSLSTDDLKKMMLRNAGEMGEEMLFEVFDDDEQAA